MKPIVSLMYDDASIIILWQPALGVCRTGSDSVLNIRALKAYEDAGLPVARSKFFGHAADPRADSQPSKNFVVCGTQVRSGPRASGAEDTKLISLQIIALDSFGLPFATSKLLRRLLSGFVYISSHRP